MLVHGWQDDNSLWSPLIDELDRRGRALVAFDLPGHGASGGDWGVSFEGTDAIVAVADALGPIDAVVAHSAGCGMAVAAILEGWTVECAALIAPPLVEGDRWRRYADRLGVNDAVALAAKAAYFDRVGPERAAWNPRPLTRPSTSMCSSCIHVTTNATPFGHRGDHPSIPRQPEPSTDSRIAARHVIPRSSTSADFVA
jgi:pimeloyl-ACP methyl ester carboxylesterase